MSQPLLSIGMIVKNEERCLEKCLKALEPLRQAIPCELVIADTGSTDKTKEIASKYADILFDFTWVNDFSAARNAVMNKCSGKWYLTIDADEYLSPDISELVNFLTDSKNKYILASVIQRNFVEPDMKGIYSDLNALRLVLLSSKRRYIEPIHEHIEYESFNEIHILSNTVLNHDGYSNVSEDYLEKKQQRNLLLLQKKLKKSPDDLGILLECLESSSKNMQSRLYYCNLTFEVLKNFSTSNPQWNLVGPACARQILVFAFNDKSSQINDIFDWIFKNFPKSNYTLIDAAYIYTKYLYSSGNYNDTIVAGKKFIKATNEFKHNDSFGAPLLYSHKTFKSEIEVIVAHALLETKKEQEALSFLFNVNLSEQPLPVINNWFLALNKVSVTKKVTDALAEFFEKYIFKNSADYKDTYDHIIYKVTSYFSSTASGNEYEIFSDIPGAIGLSAKIADSKSKAEAEKLLNKIENFEEFMPLALKQALLLKYDLPEKFYLMSSSRLALLIDDLSKVAEELVDVLSEYYCIPEKLNNFPYTSFFYNLLSIIVSKENTSLSNNVRIKLINNLIIVSDSFLNSCYNADLLSNEKSVACIPAPHLFSWYLIKAINEKEQNPLEYIRTLKTALKKVPQAKQIVEFLIEEFKNEEELKRQEKIKTTSPELIQMAEQLKTMLKAFPENSPELLAIKQSPVYQQVKFLIEE